VTTTPQQTSQQAPEFSIFNPDSAPSPYTLYAQLRASGAVVPMPVPFGNTQTSGNAWMVTQYPKAVQLLKDHASPSMPR
jgi:cytochrome P450